ncbi:hypothetical protein FQR65_LT10596 [Abscondita terminalis]|nr:hypothetical protein FQR65_LT10596 [Abscondita terminalis]
MNSLPHDWTWLSLPLTTRSDPSHKFMYETAPCGTVIKVTVFSAFLFRYRIYKSVGESIIQFDEIDIDLHETCSIMTHKPLTQKELEDIVRDMFNEPEQDEETNFRSSDSDFSEEEIGKQDEASSSEQENTSDESEEEEEPMEEIFIGKNKSTEWRKTTGCVFPNHRPLHD